jgi:broad specificity phosphatase PhoE
MPIQQVYLIRHGETAWSLSGQHTGTTDIPLTENGRRVAKLLQSVLTKETFTLVLTSPLQRARETCALAGLGERAKIERDLMEWRCQLYPEDFASAFDVVRIESGRHQPDGERVFPRCDHVGSLRLIIEGWSLW